MCQKDCLKAKPTRWPYVVCSSARQAVQVSRNRANAKFGNGINKMLTTFSQLIRDFANVNVVHVVLIRVVEVDAALQKQK